MSGWEKAPEYGVQSSWLSIAASAALVVFAGLALANCAQEEAKTKSEAQQSEEVSSAAEAPISMADIVAAQTSPSPFLSFTQEANRTTAAINCREARVTAAEPGVYGPLYGCIQGRAATAKYWINARADDPETVENVKVMWNRWTVDIGSGAVDADEAEAWAMVEAALRLYEIDNPQAVIDWFIDREVGSRSFEDDRFRVSVTKSEGPAINEHLLVIEPR